MNTLHGSIGFFSAAAPVGAYLAHQVFKGQETRKGVAIIHGILAATGLSLLGYTAYKEQRNDLLVPTAVFVGAALGGSYLFMRDIMGKRPQPSVTAIHGGVAVTALSLLIAKTLGARRAPARIADSKEQKAQQRLEEFQTYVN